MGRGLPPAAPARRRVRPRRRPRPHSRRSRCSRSSKRPPRCCTSRTRRRRCGSRRRGSTRTWIDEFLALVKSRAGVADGRRLRPAGPRHAWPSCAKAIPTRYPIRGYPDITHSRQCQHPVPDWDLAYALTEGRESINPRPLAEAAISEAYSARYGRLPHLLGRVQRRRQQVRLERASAGIPTRTSSTILRAVRAATSSASAIADRFAQALLAPRAELERAAPDQRRGRDHARQLQDMERTARAPRSARTGDSSRPSIGLITTPTSATA